MKLFDWDDVGKMGEYVVCKINGYYGFTFTQPVMLQIFSNEFYLIKKVPTTPEMPGKTLTKATEEDVYLYKETT